MGQQKKGSRDGERTRAEPQTNDGAVIPAGRPARPRFKAPPEGLASGDGRRIDPCAHARHSETVPDHPAGLRAHERGRTPTRRLPVMTHSGISPRLDSSTVAGAASALRHLRGPRTDFPFNLEGKRPRGTERSTAEPKVFSIGASIRRPLVRRALASAADRAYAYPTIWVPCGATAVAGPNGTSGEIARYRARLFRRSPRPCKPDGTAIDTTARKRWEGSVPGRRRAGQPALRSIWNESRSAGLSRLKPCARATPSVVIRVATGFFDLPHPRNRPGVGSTHPISVGKSPRIGHRMIQAGAVREFRPIRPVRNRWISRESTSQT